MDLLSCFIWGTLHGNRSILYCTTQHIHVDDTFTSLFVASLITLHLLLHCYTSLVSSRGAQKILYAFNMCPKFLDGFWSIKGCRIISTHCHNSKVLRKIRKSPISSHAKSRKSTNRISASEGRRDSNMGAK